MKHTLYMPHIISFNFLARCFILCVGLLFFINTSTAQKVKLYYDLKKDREWVERMTWIIKKGYSNSASEDKTALRMIKYFNNCVALGRYYERVFDFGKIKSMKQSLYYFEKITEYGYFPGNGKYYKAAAICNNVSRRVADIYFKGKGVKKDNKKSLAMALKGSSGIPAFFEYYSKKYFKKVSNVLQLNASNTDLSYTIVLNPFALQMGITALKNEEKIFLKKIADKYNENNLYDTSLLIYVKSYPTTTGLSQYQNSNAIEKIKTFFVEKLKIKLEKVYFDNIVEGGELGYIDIIITKPENIN